MSINSLPITVLMAAYNAEKFLKEAVDSILNQSFSEFELLVINDGSIDTTGEIIASYRDDRIRCITNERNLNLCNSLAKGVMIARGEFIARMDADDIAHPTRLEKQMAVMQAEPDLDLLGANVRWIDECGRVIGYPRVIADPIDLKWKMFFRNCFNHPTVMIRKSALLRNGLNYGEMPDSIAEFLPERVDGIGDEDYLLFGQLCLHGKSKNLNEVLLDYRIHVNSLTALFSQKQSEQTKRISSALRALYLQQASNPEADKKRFEFTSQGMESAVVQKQINAIAKKMRQECLEPGAQRQIETQRRLQCAISDAGRQIIWKRIMVGLGLVMNLAPLTLADFPLLLRYVFGDKFAAFYKRRVRIRGF
jgi:glycosyltransferase involved in cell wall biosynthesis